MAGDWIPMRTDLEDDPTVIYVARMLRLQPDHVVGKLHRFWSWADSHTADGRLLGVDADWIDAYVKKRGFATVLATAPHPWLAIDKDGVTLTNFAHWFGSSAKSRMLNTRRQQVSRSQRDNCNSASATETRPPNRTEEKRLIAPALGGAEFDAIKAKAKKIADKIGSCGNDRNRRLLLGACALSAELGDEWLETAVRETREAHAEKPYAYLRTVLTRTSDELGLDFKSSVARLVFPTQNGSSQPTQVLPC